MPIPDEKEVEMIQCQRKETMKKLKKITLAKSKLQDEIKRLSNKQEILEGIEILLDSEIATVEIEIENLKKKSESEIKPSVKTEVKSLLDKNLIQPGTIYHRYRNGDISEGEILENGRIKVVKNGNIKLFKHLSPAAEYAADSLGIDGWRWWKYKDENGKEWPLKELRERLERNLAQNKGKEKNYQICTRL
jgi:hypothetical protein